MLNINYKKYIMPEKMSCELKSCKDLEKDLLSFFSDIIYVSDNPASLKVTNIYKIEDEVITDVEYKEFELETLVFKEDCISLILSEEICLLESIIHESPHKNVNLSLWNRVLGKEMKIIHKHIKRNIKKEDYIITSEEIAKDLDIENKIFINNTLEESVVIGEKKSIVLYDKLYHLDNNYKKIMHNIDYRAFKVLDIIKY